MKYSKLLHISLPNKFMLFADLLGYNENINTTGGSSHELGRARQGGSPGGDPGQGPRRLLVPLSLHLHGGGDREGTSGFVPPHRHGYHEGDAGFHVPDSYQDRERFRLV